jgi:glycosyltransferase involved in cell wall biosynthesis
MPPEANGIADYTYHLLAALMPYYNCVVYAEAPDAHARDHVDVRDALQAFRYVKHSIRILHQVGNNPGHVFVLDALRSWGGVTTLHDQNLHYLYEVFGASQGELTRRMLSTNKKLGATFARHWREAGVKTMSNYALFDMLDEVLTCSNAVIVHSNFAKRRIEALYGDPLSRKVAVVPHLVLPINREVQTMPRGLKLARNTFLILTAGFATAAKRFDWLVAALDEIARRGCRFYWVHAGKERADEYPLSTIIARFPEVQSRTTITGYLTEAELNSLITCCDILVNLRYPSVGESSGTLARAMNAGKCVLVSDTAAYAELPRQAVVHVPIRDPVSCLAAALEALLNNADARHAFGDAARAHATEVWSAEAVGKAYADVIEANLCAGSPSTMLRRLEANKLLWMNLDEQSSQEELIARAEQADDVVFRFEESCIRQIAMLTLDKPDFIANWLPLGFRVKSIWLDVDGSDADAATSWTLLDEIPVRLCVHGTMR